jgi:hypothetical protein
VTIVIRRIVDLYSNKLVSIADDQAFDAAPEPDICPFISAADLGLPDLAGVMARDRTLNSRGANIVIECLDMLAQMEAGTAAPGRSMQSFATTIMDEFDTLLAQIIRTRDEIFEVVNDGTELVYGRLRNGRGIRDRDAYVRSLHEYVTLAPASSWYGPLLPAHAVIHPREFHHSSALFGDCRALLKGRPVPDLIYYRQSLAECRFVR